MTLKLAGVCGLDPGPMTLAELLVMAEGKREHDGALWGELWALIANCHRDSKKRSRPYTPRDVFPFLPRPKRKRRTATAEEKAIMAASVGNGRKIRKVN